MGSGTRDKSVYESYRVALSAFSAADPALRLTNIKWVDWVFDVTETGAVTIDDIVFAQGGLCE